MNFVEFIGFFILILAFIISGMQKAREQKKRRENPEEFEKEEREREEALRELFGALGIPQDAPIKKAKPKQPPPPPQTSSNRGKPFQTTQRKSLRQIAKEKEEQRKSLEVVEIKAPVVLKSPHVRKGRDLVVSKEIFDRPVGFRDESL